eukprot:676444-Rhodomonas_salina.1
MSRWYSSRPQVWRAEITFMLSVRMRNGRSGSPFVTARNIAPASTRNDEEEPPILAVSTEGFCSEHWTSGSRMTAA